LRRFQQFDQAEFDREYMQFYFIRHAQSTNNALYDQSASWQGRSHDPELTNLGQQQAQLLAQFLKRGESSTANAAWDPQNASGFGLTHLYASLMVRALHTGSIVAAELGRPLLTWEDLHETGGLYLDDEQAHTKTGQPGLNRAELAERFPHLVLPETVYETGWWNRPFEEAEQWPIRARRFLNDLLARHANTLDRVAVISHGGFYHQVLTALLDLPARHGLWFLMNNAGISRIDFYNGNLTLVYSNRVDFLPGELIT